MNGNIKSPQYLQFIQEQTRKRRLIALSQISLLIIFLLSWEILARLNLINTFLISSPSAIYKLLIDYIRDGSLFKHIGISLWETILGFSLGTLIGIVVAIILWYSNTIAKIFDPFLVVLNALPKTALAPILIVWAGAGIRGIIVIAISISVVSTILAAYNYFINVDKEKIRMLQSFGANRFQILTKLILPANTKNIINIIKINIGLSWVGVIVGEFLVSRAGIGYLIVYGGQVFRLDLVMMGVFVLAICALLMYQIINLIERFIEKNNS